VDTSISFSANLIEVFFKLHNTSEIQHTHTHPYEYAHANPTSRSIFEICAGILKIDGVTTDGNVAYH
jgi:hypothetical protein